MDVEINRIVKKCKPKIKAILRTRGFYGVPDLIRQFKSHIWPILEGTCGAFFHASDTHLHRIGKMQRLFSRELGLSEEAAFLEHILRQHNCAGTLQCWGSFSNHASELHTRNWWSCSRQFQCLIITHAMCCGKHQFTIGKFMISVKVATHQWKCAIPSSAWSVSTIGSLHLCFTLRVCLVFSTISPTLHETNVMQPMHSGCVVFPIACFGEFWERSLR